MTPTEFRDAAKAFAATVSSTCEITALVWTPSANDSAIFATLQPFRGASLINVNADTFDAALSLLQEKWTVEGPKMRQKGLEAARARLAELEAAP